MSDVTREVLEAEARRNAALRDHDWETVDALLDDDLTYVHLSGRTST